MNENEAAKTMAQRLLKRRNTQVTLWTYLQPSLATKMMISIAIAYGTWFFYTHNRMTAATFIAGFWIGQVIRDLRWYASLSKQWPVTSQFIDWEKVERSSADD